MRGLKLQMSASREKKSRQSDPTQGLTQKERKELQEQQAAKDVYKRQSNSRLASATFRKISGSALDSTMK